MELDTRTSIIASLAVAALLGATALVVARSHPAAQPLRLWGGALLLLAAGLAGVALRGTIPLFASVVVANTLIVAAIVVAHRSVRAFRGPPPPDRLGWALVALVFASLWALSGPWPHLGGRIAVLSVVRAFLLARTAVELGRAVPPECRLSFGFTRAVFWAGAAAMLARGATGAWQPPAGDFMAPNAVNALPYLVFSCVSVAATLGVFWMVVQLLGRELVRLATQDALTGMLNRTAFLGEFEREASRSLRAGQRFSLAFFDLDHFKQLNDRHGHPAGDEVLRRVARGMRACLRRHDLLGRLGGEEFAVLMPAADKETALRIAERIRAAVQGIEFEAHGERVRLAVSGGVATRGEDGETWEALFAAADRALYRAKGGGRNRVEAAGLGALRSAS